MKTKVIALLVALFAVGIAAQADEEGKEVIEWFERDDPFAAAPEGEELKEKVRDPSWPKNALGRKVTADGEEFWAIDVNVDPFAENPNIVWLPTKWKLKTGRDLKGVKILKWGETWIKVRHDSGVEKLERAVAPDDVIEKLPGDWLTERVEANKIEEAAVEKARRRAERRVKRAEQALLSSITKGRIRIQAAVFQVWPDRDRGLVNYRPLVWRTKEVFSTLGTSQGEKRYARFGSEADDLILLVGLPDGVVDKQSLGDMWVYPCGSQQYNNTLRSTKTVRRYATSAALAAEVLVEGNE